MEYQPPLAIPSSYCCPTSTYRLGTVQESSAQRRISQAPCIPMSPPSAAPAWFLHDPSVSFRPPHVCLHGEPCLIHYTIPYLSLVPGTEELHSQGLMNETLGKLCILSWLACRAVAGTLGLVCQSRDKQQVTSHPF